MHSRMIARRIQCRKKFADAAEEAINSKDKRGLRNRAEAAVKRQSSVKGKEVRWVRRRTQNGRRSIRRVWCGKGRIGGLQLQVQKTHKQRTADSKRKGQLD
ncbi:hypothetical protein PDE_00618 [Penicillium oxalicum 114-2]|uniref:Uncharacterized protein n=2 Tax=Penicillium oxalicum TaxID=69781 RepID=S7Z6C4_PENO1|nr:hypothetical protein PDE_00618 [Penicillium oxalicum 114-2]